MPSKPQNDTSPFDKFMGIFNKKEMPITLNQIWYRGLPNNARYCLWPILIGNQLGLSKTIYESVLIQVRSIRSKTEQQETLRTVANAYLNNN